MQLIRLERLIGHAEGRLRRQRARVGGLHRQDAEPGQAARMLFCLELVLERLLERRARVTGRRITPCDRCRRRNFST